MNTYPCLDRGNIDVEDAQEREHLLREQYGVTQTEHRVLDRQIDLL